MLVRNWMSRDVITINENESMPAAIKLMKENHIRMLPVINENKLVGIITDRDLKRASASDASTLEIHELFYLLSKIKITQVMTPNPIFVRDDLTVEETAEILLRNKLSGAPVLDRSNNLVGMITKSDLFKVLISLTGIGSKGIQWALELEDKPGSIKEVADIMRAYGGRIVSILSATIGAPSGKRNVYIRGFGIKSEKTGELREELNQVAKVLYMIDHSENRREIY